jgi:GINS complex subunit 4
MVEYLRSDPNTSEEEHFRIVLVQTEAERVKFLIRSYLRTRLHKVCPARRYTALHNNTTTPVHSFNLD